MVIQMKTKAIVLATLALLATSLLAQKKPEKPKLHSDFYFGTYPVSRDAGSLLAKEPARFLLLGFHQGWDIEKIAKESKVAEDELEKTFADLEDAKLAWEVDEYTIRPLMTVIRDKDIEKVQKDIRIDSQDFANVFRTNWAEIEKAAASFTGAKNVPKPQLMYQIVVGALIFGGMHDSFFEDQTLMVNPPRRIGSQRYYAWLVESDPALAGLLKREQWESGGYTMVSIGSEIARERASLEQVRASNGMLLDEAEARRFRSFVAIFSREKLLPFFKKNRSDFLKALDLLDAGRYASVSEAFAWYYDQMANGAAAQLVSTGLIQPPQGSQYVYALRAPAR
jgi:hypothetical protein